MSQLHLFEFTSVSFLSAPYTAEKCRNIVVELLTYHKKVEIDFSNVFATVGFLEHLILPLLETRGEAILDRLFFANCSNATENLIDQVIKGFHNIPLPQTS